MNRRKFLKSACLSCTTGVLFNDHLSLANPLPRSFADELSHHIIDHIELPEVDFHWPRFVGKNGKRDNHGQYKKCRVAKIYTNKGASGWGLATGVSTNNILEIKGRKLGELIAPGKGTANDVDKVFDFALHDLMGKVLGKPVYKLIGNKGTKATPIYSGMIYLDELNKGNPDKNIDIILRNCEWDYDYGYQQLKIKIGRSGRWYPHGEGLAKDIEVVRAIHEAFKDRGVKLLVDANDMYSVQDTKDFLKGIEDVPLLWIEEPFRENADDIRELKSWMNTNGFTNIYFADGEAQPDHQQCMQLAEEGLIDVYLHDTYGYGFTNWMKLMPELSKINTLASPHAWGNQLKTHYNAHISAAFEGVVTIEGVTCFSDDIDYGDYKIEDGKINVSEQPGFGMELLEK